MGRKRKLQASTICQAEGTSSESGIDRCSNLPEEVAHHVLSFLNFKDLTRVGALSKRCRQFHLSVPVVDFVINQWTDAKKVARLMGSFDRYLLDRGHNRIQRVCIGLSSYKTETAKKVSDDYSRVLKWIHNAVRCNVEELDLYFLYWGTSMLLPSFIFHSQSLRSLSVSSGTSTLEIVEAPSLSFSSNLRYLSLSDVKIVDDGIFKWISCCCKYLKELSLISMKGTQNISIESSSLESFFFSMTTAISIYLALYKEGSTRTLILDNIRYLSIHCESLNNKLVSAVVSLLRRMPNLNIFCINTGGDRLTPRTASRLGNEYWKL